MTDHRAALRAALGDAGDVVENLTPEEAEQLLSLLRRAQTAQRRSLDSSIDQTLKVLPRFVRIPARSILFGK
ncbi:hypothetical protein D7D52_33775 [Nocardia yunnanensis]|uniref:Uncharacterized protein n=1 Tax=Nocardia yunnanensis TaxID=2382165 RepID=A0A386ZK45_9NOCA|nr:hypothetical protein [Nocardia yunnanensis]AYF77967.1 hypothetical protein D7D52_33775 [Nocardia yunnanensis]